MKKKPMKHLSNRLNIKKILSIGVLGLAAAHAAPALAVCSPVNGWRDRTLSFAFPATIPIQRDAPVGTILTTQTIPIADQIYLTCTPDTPNTPLNAAFTNGWTPGTDNIANTNVPGVGIRIAVNNIGSNRRIPFTVTSGAIYPNPVWQSARWIIDLIKTGPISGGQITLGRYAGYAVTNVYWILYINATSGGQITPLACSVTNAAITVPMGNIRPNQFSGPGTGAGDRDFPVALNCDANTRVNITLEGTADSSGVPGVLALNPSSTTPVARGVGLQLSRGGTPVTLGTPIPTGTAAAAGPYAVTLHARYYQTAATITGGQANSTATFTMTYN